MKQFAKFSLIALLPVVALLAATAWFPTERYHLSTERQTFPLMPWEDYAQAAREAESPLIRNASIGKGTLLAFGAEHSNDPAHPQFAALDQAFADFAPTVVLVEGRPSVLFPWFMDATEEYGESGRLIELARDSDVPAYSWEFARADEARLLNEAFSPEQTAIYLLMRPFPGGATKAEAESAMAAIIADRSDNPGIEGVFADLDAFDAAWTREFAGSADWRDLRGVYNAPGFLGEMFKQGNDNRDQNLLNMIRELTDDGERVMVTMGWSHTLRIEPAIAAMEGNAK